MTTATLLDRKNWFPNDFTVLHKLTHIVAMHIQKILRYQLAVLVLSIWTTSYGFCQSAHYWARTSGLPGWHRSSNWAGGLPGTNDLAFFTNPTNGTVYITEFTGVMQGIYFNTSSTSTSNVYAKFRGDPGFGLYGLGIYVGSNSGNRTAFVDLDRGTHRAGSAFVVYDGSRLDVRDGATVESDVFANLGTVNLKGKIETTGDFAVSGFNSQLSMSSGLLDTNALKVANNGRISVTGGSIQASSLEITTDNNLKGNGEFVFSGTRLDVGSVSIHDGRFSFQSGRFQPKANSFLSLQGLAEVEVGSGKTLEFKGKTTLGFASSSSPVTNATLSGPGEIRSLGGTQLYNDSSLTLKDGITFDTDSAIGASNNGSHRSITIDGNGTQLRGGDIEIGSYGGMSFDVKNGASVASHQTKLRDGLFGSVGAIVNISGAGSEWHNSTAFQVGFGDSNTQRAHVTIQDSGLLSTGYMKIADPTGSANKGEVYLRSNGHLNVLQRLDIETGGSLHFEGGFATVAGLKLSGGIIDKKSGSLTIDRGVYDIGSASQVIIGSNAGDTFTQSFLNGASMDTGPIRLEVGHSGAGTMNVRSGSVVKSNSGTLGTNQSSSGTVNVDGPDSEWIITPQLSNGFLTEGGHGNGTLNIINGGTVSNVLGLISQGPSTGIVNVNGSGSTWQSSGNLLVGGYSGGTGTLNIENQGMVAVGDTMTVTSNGSIHIDGGILDAEAIELLGGDFHVNDGLVSVDRFMGNLTQVGGTLAPGDSPGLTEIDGDYEMGVGATLQLEIAGLNRATQYDALDVTGLTTLNGTIDVNFIDGFNAAAGDQFDFVDAASLSANGATFDFADAVLSGGLVWDTTQFGSNGVLQVMAVSIPEPGAVYLIAWFSSMLSIRRRRQI